MNTLVIGYGSIGSRHARILQELGHRVAVVTRREIDFPLRYATIEEAVAAEQPEYSIVATTTVEHYDTLSRLANCGFAGDVLVEKPLFDSVREAPEHNFRGVFVAYNFRFHAVIQRLREFFENETIVSVEMHNGQYLPQWRPHRDYRQSYSASRAAGGGVLRDLSHELDYLNWLLGGWQRLTAIGGHFSALEIESDDVFQVLMTTRKCPVVSMHVNYLDRIAHRELRANTNRHTVIADILHGTFQIDDRVEDLTRDRDYAYRTQLEAFLGGDRRHLSTLDEGLETMRMIEAADRAAQTGTWIERTEK